MSRLVAVLTTALLASLFFFACGDDPVVSPEPKPEAPPLPDRPGLLIVGNDQGMIRPCGCSKPLLGGIVRRGAFLDALDPETRAASTLVGVGGMIHEGGRQQELKLEAFLESLQVLGATVILPNEHDLLVGSRFWTDVLFQRGEGDPPLVAGNLVVAGNPLFQTEALVRLAGRDVVVSSWLWPDSGVLSEPGVELLERPELGNLKALLAAEADRPRDLLLYSTAPEPIARAWLESEGLLEAAAEVLLLVSGPSDLPMVVASEPGYVAAEVGQKGRDVAHFDWPKGVGMTGYSLVEAYGGHARQQEILDFYRGNVAAEQLLFNLPKFEMAEGAYAGAEACATCHQQAFEVWKKSGHAHAFATLKDVGDDQDPECVRCHVVDYHRMGGFDPVSVEPVDVQCEACHGPSAEHADNPAQPTPRPKMRDDDCRVCHDLANSPAFSFETYWPKIAHGK